MRDRPGWKSQGWGQIREIGGCGRLRRQKQEEGVGSLSLKEAHTKGTEEGDGARAGQLEAGTDRQKSRA